MSLVGIIFLSLGEGSLQFSAGDAWSLIQPIAFGVGYWRTEHILERLPSEASRFAAAELLTCFILSLFYAIISCLMDGTVPTTMQLFDWFSNFEIVVALVWTGVITTALSAHLETEAMKTISAAETTMLISSEPIWASLFAWILVGEKLTPYGMVGGVFIFGACLVSMCT
jgi:drug/metabolite transporter (DMT)-like permease